MKRSLSFWVWAIFSLVLSFANTGALAQVPLSVTGVEPSTFELGSITTITIKGAGFIPDTTVEISRLGVLADTFVNDTTMTVDLPTGVTVGTYSVTVSNPPSETASLNDAFTITAPPPTLEPLIVNRSEPNQITSGQVNTLSVLGSGFTTGTVVRVVGFGVLETTVIQNGILGATVPATIPPGEYDIEISDTAGRKSISPNKLRVIAPPLPTAEPTSIPTPMVITTQPSLGIVNFLATPNSIAPGQSTNLTFTVQNRGNQMAHTIAVSLVADSKFVVAGGVSSITIPDLMPGAVFNAGITITAKQDVTAGPSSIPLQISYMDNNGETYSGISEISVTILSAAYQSQIVIDAYAVDPSPVEPGEAITVRMTLSNKGTATASQVTMSVASENALLLPNGRSDTFVIGDMAPGTQLPVQMPLVVSSNAENGPQMQLIVIRYYQDGEAIEVNTGITVEVALVEESEPLLLLTSYETDQDVLEPGTRFTLDADLQNVGTSTANGTIVTFGTIQSSGGGDSSGGDTQTSTAASTTFAPLGTAGVFFIGDIVADDSIRVSQDFIVAGNVTSGIYSLPITLQYGLPGGTNKQDVLNLSLVVVAPPRLRFSPSNPLQEMGNVGEPMMFSLEIANTGQNAIDLIQATVSTDNGEIMDEPTIQLERLKADDDTSINMMILPMEEGPISVELTISYINGIGQTETIMQTYSAEILPPIPPMEEPDIPIEPEPEPEPEVDWFGRIVMALLGLGS